MIGLFILACGKPITKLTIKGDNLIKVGSTLTLTLEVEPSKAKGIETIEWTVDNTEVATISNKVVTGVSIGEVVVTASAPNGVKDTKTIYVVPAYETLHIFGPDSFNVNSNVVMVIKTDNEQFLDNKVVSWSVTPVENATIDDNGLLIGLVAGDIVVKAIVGDETITKNVSIISSSVTIVESSFTILAGESKKLNVNVVPNGAVVSWSSSNTTVAEVEIDGTLKAKSAGVAIITASLGIDASDSIEVNVEPVIDIEITGDKSIKIGETITLVADPSNVKWDSLNKSVATITTDGVVTGISEGTARIVASIGLNEAYYDIVVSDKDIYYIIGPNFVYTYDEVKFNISTDPNYVPVDTVLIPTLPTGVLVFTFSVDDESIATITGNGVLKALKKGSVVITLTHHVNLSEEHYYFTLEIDDYTTNLTVNNTRTNITNANNNYRTSNNVHFIAETVLDGIAKKLEIAYNYTSTGIDSLVWILTEPGSIQVIFILEGYVYVNNNGVKTKAPLLNEEISIIKSDFSFVSFSNDSNLYALLAETVFYNALTKTNQQGRNATFELDLENYTGTILNPNNKGSVFLDVTLGSSGVKCAKITVVQGTVENSLSLHYVSYGEPINIVKPIDIDAYVLVG